MPRKKSKKSNRYYFTKDHEDAIVKYASTKDREVRTKLYIEWIQPAFSEMVDKIVYTYKFSNLPNIDLLRDDCKIWLTTILDKYDPNKGSKAFSYFSVITKNWFIHKVKKNTQQNRRELDYDNLSKNIEQNYLSTDIEYNDQREYNEFWEHLWTEIESWDTGKLKENERKVLEAVKIILQNSDNIEIFNKKAVYLYLRELTGLNTKQVVNCLNKMRDKYKKFKVDWNEGKY
tara:strand:- start:2786 stop:3478 length:693 start_codon:yes stop_codon:yes gene_type:complete